MVKTRNLDLMKAFGYIERVVKFDFFSENTFFYIMRAQRVLSNHLIKNQDLFIIPLKSKSFQFSFLIYLYRLTFLRTEKLQICRDPAPGYQIYDKPKYPANSYYL